MKKLLTAVSVTILILMTAVSCSSADAGEEKEDNIAYGQVVDTTEDTITVREGIYRHGEKFRKTGGKVTYDLPDEVFHDDFAKGDIVSFLHDGNDALGIMNVDDIYGESETGPYKGGAGEAEMSADGLEKDLDDGSIRITEDGRTAVMAVNSEGRMNIARSSIGTEGSSSRGIMAASEGYIGADQIEIRTEGSRSPAVETYDEESTIDIDDSILTTEGSDSPCILSSGKVSLSNVEGRTEGGTAAVVNLGGVVNLTDSEVDCGGMYFADMRYRAGDDSRSRKAILEINESDIKAPSAGGVFRVSGGSGRISLTDTDIDSPSGILATVDSDGRGHRGKLILMGTGQDLSGDIVCGGSGAVKLILSEESSFRGSVDRYNSAGYSKVSLSRDSVWKVTGDSYVTSLLDDDMNCRNIISNGHDIYYDSSRPANSWLDGKTVELRGGGNLIPY